MNKKWHKHYYNSKNNKRIAYVNANIFDPSLGLNINGALITHNGIIEDYGVNLFGEGGSFTGIDEVIDCHNHLLIPGVIDMHVHFREPGQEYKETILTGTMAAAAGGVTTVVCQPNTSPVIDDVYVLSYLNNKIEQDSYIKVLSYGAVTKGLEGKELVDMAKMVDWGIAGFTDDGLPVMNSLIMFKALQRSSSLDIVIAQHAEDINLSNSGCMNYGEVSKKLGVPGIPNISEAIIISRDLFLCQLLPNSKYHVLHVSAKQSLELIEKAKNNDVNVTCEVTPHHFILNDSCVEVYGTAAKMNPPLRKEEDRLSMVEGLKSGIIDCIASDHAPHEPKTKDVSLQNAAFGIIGVETLLVLSLELYHKKLVPLDLIVRALTSNPAKIMNIKDRGTLAKGSCADLTIVDLHKEYSIDIKGLASKSHNSPFKDRKVKGMIMKTIVNGNVVFEVIN